MSDLVLQIDALLPQTQCTKCGYQGCLPYAEAIAQGEAINRCPPGGQAGVKQLAQLLSRPELPLNTEECGEHQPLQVAVIDEEHCIGCTLCIQACPVDAILGANKFMHTVLADACTGCDLCVAPCPVDCISMIAAEKDTWTSADATKARLHHQQHLQRLQAQEDAELARLRQASIKLHSQAASTTSSTSSHPTPSESSAIDSAQARKEAIANALARARARRQHVS
ncbi:electron transport complex subunit RsxB [Brackiella oedipodis]|uniref:electron transport complex subunit RsxB n=1 Tax=Brackiella oedipodis TaxID=124225 RepID=UPI00048C2781|nr:electron transport complex subunit RsxB [Brackiella oedipodis]